MTPGNLVRLVGQLHGLGGDRLGVPRLTVRGQRPARTRTNHAGLTYRSDQEDCDLFIGPVFMREASTTPRRPRHFIQRTVYLLALLILICTAWFVLTGTQIVRNVGDMARFGSALFQILAPLQLALVTFLSAFGVASAVSQEKDRRTLILLLMTRMTNSELVLGKLFASLLDVFVMIVVASPVFVLITLFGGISFDQVARSLLVTLTTAFAAGSLGSIVALRREKTFQTLSITALVLVIWTGIWEATLLLGPIFPQVPWETVATGCSPFRAIQAASSPIVSDQWTIGQFLTDGVSVYLLTSLLLAALMNYWAILRVRVWNPSREMRPGPTVDETASIWGVEHDLEHDGVSVAATEADDDSDSAVSAAASGQQRATGASEAAEVARAGHVDARVRATSAQSREVWDNPVLWREMCTWAYGRKVAIIRVAYLVLFAMVFAALYGSVSSGAALQRNTDLGTVVPVAAQPLAPFILVSLVIINALAVNSITNERDGQALDLLLVTDLSPKEFVFGKLGGVLWVTKEMVVAPMLLCAYLWLFGAVTLENLLYLLGGLAAMIVFVTMLGIHFGMTYANSRSAIGISLGAVFFLFVGVVTCLMIMISFTGSFQGQYAPFLAFVGGGSVGLFAALGSRNPSAAIFWASLLLPSATFFAIVSFVLGNQELTIFLVIVGIYGFTTASLMIPAIAEFDIAMGRTKTAAEE